MRTHNRHLTTPGDRERDMRGILAAVRPTSAFSKVKSNSEGILQTGVGGKRDTSNKQTLLLAVCIFFSGLAIGQTAYDSSYKSTYYEQKVTLFQLLPDTKNEIIFLGNSITDIGEWQEIWQNSHVKNRGISGDNTFGVLARLDEVLSSRPAKVFLMIGINDIASQIPDSVIIANHKKIYKRIKLESPKTKLYVESILPTNSDFSEFKNHQNKDEHIRNINSALQKICSEEGIVYIDLYTHFLDESGKLDKRYTNDGLHINGSGYMLWKQILKEKGYMK